MILNKLVYPGALTILLVFTFGCGGGANGGNSPEPSQSTHVTNWTSQIEVDTPSAIDDAPGSTIHNLTSDSEGNLTAVWQQTQNHTNVIYASRFSPDLGVWSSPQSIDTPHLTAGLPNAPSAVVDPSGNVTSVWSYIGNGSSTIYATHFSSTTNQWTTPQLIDPGATCPLDPHASIAIDTLTGDTIAAWEQFTGASEGIFFSRYNIATNSWSTPQEIDSSSNGSIRPVLACDPLGNITLVWIQYDKNSNWQLSASHYSSSTQTWEPPVEIEASNASLPLIPETPVLRTDASGNVFAVWKQNISGQYIVTFARYDNSSSTWSAPVEIGPPGAPSGSVDSVLVIDDSGNGLAVWTQTNTDGIGVVSSYYSATNNTWSAPQEIDPSAFGGSYPTLEFEGNGIFRACWSQNVYYKTLGWIASVKTATFDFAQKSWTTPEQVSFAKEAYDDGAIYPICVSDTHGHSSINWIEIEGGIYKIYSAHHK